MSNKTLVPGFTKPTPAIIADWIVPSSASDIERRIVQAAVAEAIKTLSPDLPDASLILQVSLILAGIGQSIGRANKLRIAHSGQHSIEPGVELTVTSDGHVVSAKSGDMVWAISSGAARGVDAKVGCVFVAPYPRP